MFQIWQWKNFGMGTYMTKSMTMHIMHSYICSPDKDLKDKVTTLRSKVKSGRLNKNNFLKKLRYLLENHENRQKMSSVCHFRSQ